MRIVPTAISALLLCGEVMSFESYVPQEFWGNVEVLKPNLEDAVEYANSRLENVCFFLADWLWEAQARFMCQYLYPRMENYMKNANPDRSVPTEEEFWGSIGFSNLHTSDNMDLIGDIECDDVLKFFDNVESIIGKPPF